MAKQRAGVIEGAAERRLGVLRAEEQANRLTQPHLGATPRVEEGGLERAPRLVPLLRLQAEEERLLVGEVLVQRAHAHARRLGDADGGESEAAVADQNA